MNKFFVLIFYLFPKKLSLASRKERLLLKRNFICRRRISNICCRRWSADTLWAFLSCGLGSFHSNTGRHFLFRSTDRTETLMLKSSQLSEAVIRYEHSQAGYVTWLRLCYIRIYLVEICVISLLPFLFG